jgi:hypothetical protein
MSVGGVHRVDRYSILVKEYEMYGISARTLEMNTENSWETDV